MKTPEHFGFTLTACVAFIGSIFILIGGIHYLTFGIKVEVQVFLNLPSTPITLILQLGYRLIFEFI